jgi:CrcB protein
MPVADKPARLVDDARPASQADVDPDLDISGADTAPAGSPCDTARRSRPVVPWLVLAAVSTGGVIGALARYGLGSAFPPSPNGFPWATFGINVSGCLLIGGLMVLITDVWRTRRLLRPFLGTGLLGGYTTFSTYIVEIQHLLNGGAARTALAYLAGTLLAAPAATYLGVSAARLAVHRTGHRRGTR